jgi:outer membrane protein OmpA-like peptidoglycan-associated protein
MRRRFVAVLSCLVVLSLVVSTGCVTKKLFRQNVEETDTRVAAAETGIEANERRIKDLKSETDARVAAVDQKAAKAVEVGNSAMSKAEQAALAAEDAAKGKLLWSVTLSDDSVRFSFDQASIPSEAAAVLDDLIEKIKSYNKAVYVEIAGHTDNTGSEDYNLSLGEKRAWAVRDYMGMKGGIPLHAMSVISYGESQPVADNATPEGRAQNRRVVVSVLE